MVHHGMAYDDDDEDGSHARQIINDHAKMSYTEATKYQ
jgi:hypothetical protein